MTSGSARLMPARRGSGPIKECVVCLTPVLLVPTPARIYRRRIERGHDDRRLEMHSRHLFHARGEFDFRGDYPRWLGEAPALANELQALLRPFPTERMKVLSDRPADREREEWRRNVDRAARRGVTLKEKLHRCGHGR
jgi:hypothetical protein